MLDGMASRLATFAPLSGVHWGDHELGAVRLDGNGSFLGCKAIQKVRPHLESGGAGEPPRRRRGREVVAGGGGGGIQPRGRPPRDPVETKQTEYEYSLKF